MTTSLIPDIGTWLDGTILFWFLQQGRSSSPSRESTTNTYNTTSTVLYLFVTDAVTRGPSSAVSGRRQVLNRDAQC